MYRLLTTSFIVILLMIKHSTSATDSIIVDIGPNEAITKKLNFDNSTLNQSSAIVLKTKIQPSFAHNDESKESNVFGMLNNNTEQSDGTIMMIEGEGSVFATALYNGHINHWKLESNDETLKTLCTTSEDLKGKTNEISLGLFSTREEKISVEFEILHDYFFIELEDVTQVNLEGRSPVMLQFRPQLDVYRYGEDKDETYLLSVISDLNSTASNCLYVAINPPGCPWYDRLENVHNSRIWSRMLKKGYFPINPQIFPHGFLISLIPVTNSSECWSHHKLKTRELFDINPLRVKIEKTPSRSTYWLPVVSSLLGLFLVGLIFSGFIIWFWWYIFQKQQSCIDNCVVDGGDKTEDTAHNEKADDALETTNDKDTSNHEATVQNEPESMEGDVSLTNTNLMRENSVWTPENAYRKHLIKDIRDIHNNRIENQKSEHCLHAVERLKSWEILIKRLKKQDHVLSDMTLMSGDMWHRRARSKSYVYLIPLVCIFYFIPSAQMVYTEYLRSKEQGNLEKCYLNYGCSRPFGGLADFNHIISNIGYVMYGLFFIILVFIKSKLLPEGQGVHEDHKSDCGPLQQHSIFYSMGMSMIFQGIFSSIFHMCPSNISLQFDTTSMYIMIILVFIKIYQLRHPDIAYNAYHTMFAFSVVLLMEALSIYIHDPLWRMILYLVFLVLYLILMVHVALDIYYYGALKTNPIKYIPIFIRHSLKYKEEILYKHKFILSTIFIIINCVIIFLIMGKSYKKPGGSLSTPILIIGATNIALYVVYYYLKKAGEIKQKICPAEGNATCTKRQTFFVFLSFILQAMAVLIGLVAAYFYANKHQSRSSTPPESRNKNEMCHWMDFFDNHDMWHFTSAVALFLAFLGLLIVDDDILFTKRDKISVF